MGRGMLVVVCCWRSVETVVMLCALVGFGRDPGGGRSGVGLAGGLSAPPIPA